MFEPEVCELYSQTTLGFEPVLETILEPGCSGICRVEWQDILLERLEIRDRRSVLVEIMATKRGTNSSNISRARE